MSEFQPYPQFLLFGDSLIQNANSYAEGFCFSAALQLRYERRLDLVNRGFNGYNTDQAVRLIPKIIRSPEHGPIKYLLILFGANDACLPSPQSGQHVPLSRFQENLRKIINHPLIVAHNPKVILVTPPPVDAARSLEADRVNKGITEVRREASTTAEYCNAVRTVGADELGDRGVVVDLWRAFMDKAIAQTPGYDHEKGPLLGSRSLGECKALVNMMADGLHPNDKGYKLFFDQVVKAIEEKWPEDEPGKMDMIFPVWDTAFKDD